MTNVTEMLQTAIALHNAERFSEAEVLYRRILESEPANADSLHLLGLLAYQHRQFTGAVSMISEAISIAPNQPSFHEHLGMAFQGLRRYDEALAAFKRGVDLAPGNADIYNNLGNLYHEMGQMAEMLACREKALSLFPNNYLFRHNYASALEQFARFEEAEAWYTSALEAKPDFADGYNGLGELYRKAGHLDQAIVQYQRTLALKPDHIHALNNLSLAYKDKGLLHEAVGVLNRCLAITPDYGPGNANLGTALQQLGRIDEAVERFQYALKLSPEHDVIHSNLIFALTYQQDTTGLRLRDEAIAWDKRQSWMIPAVPSLVGRDSDPERPIRIGFVSADFRDHAVSYFLLPLFRAFDRRQVAIVCYNETLRDDIVTGWFRDLADVWRDSRGIHDRALFDQIRADEIDILVDCSGHSGGNRLKLFKMRPAPIQFTTPLGHGGTSGVAEMDYFLSDVHLTPEGYDDQFSESLVRLDHVFAPFEPKDFWPEPFAEVPGDLVFGCFADPLRVSPRALALWGRLLDAVPGSRILFKHKTYNHEVMERHWRGRFSALGDRVDFEGLPGYWVGNMDVYRRVRVVLDSCPSTGATSTLIPLWMGVPVLSLAGSHIMERFGVPFLSNAGLGDLIATDEDSYLRIGTQLIKDDVRLARLRRDLRSTMKASPLLDFDGGARAWERQFREVWRRWCREAAA
jgi:protein O-GlcNAc transferase